MYIKKSGDYIEKKNTINATNMDKIQYEIDLSKRLARYEIQGAFEKLRYDISQITGNNSVKIADVSKRVNSEKKKVEHAVKETYKTTTKFYSDMSLSNYVDNYYKSYALTKLNDKKNKTPHLISRDNITHTIENIYQNIERQYEDMNLLIKENYGSMGLDKEIKKLTSLQTKEIKNTMFQNANQAVIDCMTDNGIKEYEYICSNSDKSCQDCMANDRRTFSIVQASSGVNYPPMHDNCSCVIVPTSEDSVSPNNALVLLEEWFKLTSPTIKLLLESKYPLLSVADTSFNYYWTSYKETLNKYMSNYTSLEIENNNYHVNIERFNGFSILPNGEILSQKKLSQDDLKLLELMKLRDEMIGKLGQVELLKEVQLAINEIVKNHKDKKDLVVNTKKTYNFYLLGEDISQRLSELMKSSEEKYTHKSEEFIATRLLEFASTVKSEAEMDLKSKPEWQKSAYILNDEIVSQDSIGNINYGHLGKVFGFSEQILVTGAGIYQVYAGTSSEEFFWSFGDDPRDSYDILRGIDYYSKTH